MPRRATTVLEPVSGPSGIVEGRGRQRQRRRVAGTERGRHRRARAHQQELAEEVVELDCDPKPAHGVRGHIFKEDDVLDRVVLLADDRGARFLDYDYGIASFGRSGERSRDQQGGRETGLHAPAG